MQPTARRSPHCIVWIAVLALSCATAQRDRSTLQPTDERASAPVEPRTLSFAAEAAPADKSSALHRDPLWEAAQSLDPMRLAALANHTGAAALLDVASQGGPGGAVALEALPWAEDARAERAGVCQLLSRVLLPERERVLRVVHQLLTESRDLGEELSPNADATCKAALAELMREPGLAPTEHDLATSTLNHLVHRSPSNGTQ